MEISDNEEDLDTQLCLYLEHSWANGIERTVASGTLSATQYALCKRRILVAAWDFMRAWINHESPSRSLPLPEISFKAMASICLSISCADVCFLLIFKYAVFLRTRVMLNVGWSGLTFGNDAIIFFYTKFKNWQAAW